MRTTVTLDGDVAVLLKKKMSREKLSFKEALNQSLRQALARTRPPTPQGTYQTPEADVGRCLVGSLDDIADVLAVAEGEDHP